MNLEIWATPVDTLPGVGPKTAEKLHDAGYRTIGQLALHVPTSYEDRRTTVALEDAEDGQDVLVEGVVRRFRQRSFRGRYQAQVELEVPTRDGATQPLVAKWFHRVGGLAERASEGSRIQVFGTVKRGGKQGRGRREMVHPKLQKPGAQQPGIQVRYPKIEGLGPASVTRLCQAAVSQIVEAWGGQEWLPSEIVGSHQLPKPAATLKMLHMPDSQLTPAEVASLRTRTSAAHRRLTFEHLLGMQLQIAQRRYDWRSREHSLCVMPEFASRERLRAILPFEPTGGQWRAVAEIEADLAASKPMLRLLQGDVGAGKTAVGFAACLAVATARGQIAWMVPTEMLATQHARTLAGWCRAAGVRLAVLTSRMPVARRRRVVEQIASAQIDLVVGTHALLSEDIAFARLGLAIIDEQHRFGVAQRALLRAKGTTPHLLVMTATPIPRTLALTSYGELDVSLIRELPPGRTPPRTDLFAGTSILSKAREQLAKRIEQGVQAFVVCPRIDRVGAQDISHVEDAAEWFRARLPGQGIGVIHGKLAASALEDAVAKFSCGELAVLVATTVIEVGIDLPNARAMLIEHADRFGLAQLHQLRGRIGRGSAGPTGPTGHSWCLLHTKQPPSSDAHRRLSVLVEAHDGFRVAEMDLELRGPGEVFGTRQAGSPGMFAACLTGAGIELLLAARETARTWLRDEPPLKSREAICRYLGGLVPVAQPAGEAG